MQCCHWQCQQHHVIVTLVPMVSHDQKIHFATPFDHLDLTNVMGPSASHYAKTCTSGIIWPKKSGCISFWLLWPNKWMVLLMILLVTLNVDTSTNIITWPKRSCYTSLQSSGSNDCGVAIANAVGVTWWPSWMALHDHVLVSWPYECSGAIDYAIGNMWCWF